MSINKLKDHYQWMQLLKDDIENILPQNTTPDYDRMLQVLCSIEYEIIHIQDMLNDIQSFTNKEYVAAIN